MPTDAEVEVLVLEALYHHQAQDVSPDSVVTYVRSKHPEVGEAQIYDVWYDLARRGVVRPGHSALPWYVTQRGQAILHDPLSRAVSSRERYVEELRQRAPAISTITLDYAGEALAAYHSQLPLAATIAIGAAAERSILDLVEAFEAFKRSAAVTQKFRNLRGFKEKYEYLLPQLDRKQLQPQLTLALAGKTTPAADLDQLFVELDTMVTRVFDLYRIGRNDAGHPTGAFIEDREVLFVELKMFVRFARTVYGLIAWLKAAS